MARTSGFWNTSGTPTGHQVANYTQALWSTAVQVISACSGREGVAPNFLASLTCTSPAVHTVRVNTGVAIIDGKWFINGSSYDLTVDSTPSYRMDRIILRANWSGFILDLYVKKGTDGSATPPTLTQTSGTTYEISLYTSYVVSGGTITLTDERTWAVIAVDSATIEEGSVGTLRVKDGSINSVKLGTQAVIAGKIATGGVSASAQVANDIIDSQHYAAGSIDLEHMSANSVDSDQYVDGSVDPIHIANRTRSFLVPGFPDDSNGGSALGRWELQGVEMPDTETTNLFGGFYVPSDFSSTMTVKAVVIPLASGNMYALNQAKHGAVGEAWDIHSVSLGATTAAVTSGQPNEELSLSLTNAAIGDYVGLYFYRYAAHTSDTVGTIVYFRGWLVSYTADS